MKSLRRAHSALLVSASALALAVGALAFSASGVTGCAAACDANHACAFDTEGLMCDGTHYSECNASIANQRVVCPGQLKAAVCTPSGWSIGNN